MGIMPRTYLLPFYKINFETNLMITIGSDFPKYQFEYRYFIKLINLTYS